MVSTILPGIILGIVLAYFTTIRPLMRKKEQAKAVQKIKENTTDEEQKKLPIPTVCPHCKNPNTKMLKECEWCGEAISINTIKAKHSGFIIEIEAICLPPFGKLHPSSLYGTVKSGEIKIGDRFYLNIYGKESILGVCKGLYWGSNKFLTTVKYGEKAVIATNITKKEIGLSNFWKTIHKIQGEITSINE